MRYIINITIISLILCLFACQPTEESIGFTKIEERFGPSTLFKNIELFPLKQLVILQDIQNQHLLAEYQYYDNNWKKISEFAVNTTGNVEPKDFLFQLTEPIKKFTLLKKDSIQNLYTISGLRIRKDNQFKGENKLKIIFEIENEGQPKTLIFNHQ